MKFFFWVSFIFIFYTYIGYPLALTLLAYFRPKPIRKEEYCQLPYVSVVLAALNEQDAIITRLENLISQDYPANCLEIVVVSDGSTDGTKNLIEKFIETQKQKRINNAVPSLEFISHCPTKGKPYSINQGVQRASGEIIVFADCRQKFEPQAIRELVTNFTDPSVGCVSGELLFVEDCDGQINAEMGAYWSYEKYIRKRESKSGSVVGATGAIYAIRADLYVELPAETLLDDVLTPLNVIFQNKRVVFEEKAKAFDTISKNAGVEWRRKVRTLAGNWQLLKFYLSFCFPSKNPIWWRFLSHKIFRLFVPYVLLLLLISSFGTGLVFYQIIAWAQIFFYFLAILGAAIPSTRRIRFVNLCYFFMVLNSAVVVGCWLWATGREKNIWRRPSP